MVTGQQTVEFDLNSVEHAKTVVVWGMNWITTKMPDAHWLTEARMKGTKVVVIACEYSATATKADDVVVVRPGNDAGTGARLRERDPAGKAVRRGLRSTQWTDLPILVRMDTLKYLEGAGGVRRSTVPNSKTHDVSSTKARKSRRPSSRTLDNIVPEKLRNEWGDYVWWDARTNAPQAADPRQCRQELDRSATRSLKARSRSRWRTASKVRCRPVFDLVKEYAAHFDPKTTEELTWAPAAAVEKLARHFAKDPGTTLFAVGMGPNQFFNSDNKDRDVFLLASLTGNVGKIGGNVGSYAGNYRDGAVQRLAPVDQRESLSTSSSIRQKPARPKQYWKAESAHYYNHEDHPLRVGK